MGGTSASGRRRWARRSCRTAGGGGADRVVRRTVAAPATTAPRVTEGFAHVDKQRRVHGVLSDFRCNSGSTDHLPLDVGEFKHKSSHRSSVRSLPSAQRNITVMSHMQPVARGVQLDKPSNDKGLCHASNTVSGVPIRPKYYLSSLSNNLKNPPTVKTCGEMSDFSYQLVRSAKRSASPKMGLTSTSCSLSEKMSLLRQQRHGDNHQSQNCISVFNRRHKILNPRGAVDLLSKDKVHEHLNSSLRHSQALLNNALIREKQLRCSDIPNQKEPEQLWSSAYSESEKIVCFSSSDSIDDLHVSSSSDTSDSSNLSSLGVIAEDEWNTTFKKVYYPHAACLDSTSVIYAKEIGQASPISVLQPLCEDCSDSENVRRDPADPYDLQLRLELGTFAPTETAAEASSIDGTSDCLSSDEVQPRDEKPIELIEEILEEFEDDEERDFSYLLDILIASGIHGTVEDQMYKVCQCIDYPAGDDVFEKLEKKYSQVVQWSRSDRKLLFDMVNTILSQILAPCLNMQPWVNATNLAPLWGSEGLLEKVFQVLIQRREQLAPSVTKPEKKGFDLNWGDLADCIDRNGRDIERMIKDDLLEELVLELLFS